MGDKWVEKRIDECDDEGVWRKSRVMIVKRG
jgi:hypothetical protein